jgi:L,D-transpeptidase ErfK/SrfK
MILMAILVIGFLAPPAWATDNKIIGADEVYQTKYEDTLADIALEHNLGFVEIRAANPHVDPWLPGDGQTIRLPKRHILPDAPNEGIVINLGDMRLYDFTDDGVITTYPVGVGRDGLSTPLGTTTITRKKQGPLWYPTARMRAEDPTLPKVVEPGPDNPLGSHALYLDWPTYLIHGTHKPYGIGRRVSSGCIRLTPAHIKTLYEKTPKGTKVTVVNQPIKLAETDDGLMMEAHPDPSQADAIEQTGRADYRVPPDILSRITNYDAIYRINWSKVRDILNKRDGRIHRIDIPDPITMADQSD